MTLLELPRHRPARRAPRIWRALVPGAALTALFVGAALLSLVWTPYPTVIPESGLRFAAPSLRHWLGTDMYGRDLLSLIMAGARISLSVALLAVGIGAGIGIPLGLLAAAYRGSPLDEAVLRFNDLVFAFPALLIAIIITAIAGPGAVNAIVAVGIFNIPVFARVARAAALGLWTRDFVLAARIAGKGTTRISLEHILPNIMNMLVVQMTIQFSLGILAEAGLAYVGLGAQPPVPSWGRMLAESQSMMMLAPHTVLVPGLSIVLVVVGLNLMGDGLRDLLDPRLRRGER